MKTNRMVVVALAAAIGNAGLWAQVPEAPMGTALLELRAKAPEKKRESLGTGFFVTYQNFVFLVTAKHVIWDVKKTNCPLRAPNLVCLTHSMPYEAGKKIVVLEIDLNGADRARELRKHSDRDVAVLRLLRLHSEKDQQLEFLPHVRPVFAGVTNVFLGTAEAAYSTRFNDARVGDDVVVAGFPASLGMENARQLEPHEPLLAKSIISGKNPDRKTLIIGLPVYYGNSGGAAWRVTQTGLNTKSFSLVGVMTELIPFDESELNKRLGRTNNNWAVSGYSVAEPMDFVIELIEQGGWK